MAKLPLTSHEQGLINQIHGEIKELNDKSLSLMNDIDKETDDIKQQKLLDILISVSKRVTERCSVRESIIHEAFNRITK